MTAERASHTLTGIAARLGLRIRPAIDGDSIVLSATEATALWGVTIREAPRTINVQHISTLLSPRTIGREPLRLGIEQTQNLARALERFDQDCDRYKRISRGQFSGPMSGSEAVRYLRGRHGRL